MADVSIDASVSTSTARGMRSVVFTTAQVGYWFYIDSGGTLVYSKTTDGGATWGAAVTVASATTNVAFDVWYDQWTPGDTTGVVIYVMFFDTTADAIFLQKIDSRDGSLVGLAISCFAGASAVAGRGAFCSVTKTRSGYIYCAFDIDAGAEHGLVRSTDGGSNWSANLSTLFVDSTIDQCLCFPATGSGDDNDMAAIYHDASADTLLVRYWDSSAAAIVNSSTIQTMVENTTDLTGQMGFSAAIRMSDGHIIGVYCSERDTATADVMAFDVNPTVSVLNGPDTLSAILSNIDDIYNPAVFIEPSTGYIYVAINGKSDGSEVLGTTTKIYYFKSIDGGTNWSAQAAYQEGATSANFQVWAPISGPRFYAGWRVGTTLLGNKVNSIDFATPVELTTTPLLPYRSRRR